MTDQRDDRRPRWTWILAAGCAAVIFGVGGLAVGAGALGGVAASDAAGADSSVSAESEGVDESAPAPAPSQERIDAPVSDSGIDFGADSSSGVPLGIPVDDQERVVLTGQGWDTAAGSGNVYGFDVATAFGDERLQRLAGAFGMTGQFVDLGTVWRLQETAADGAARTLDVQVDGEASFSYWDDTINPDTRCWRLMNQDLQQQTGQGDGAQAAEGTYEQCLADAAAEAAPAADADAALSSLLVELGWDPAQFTLETPEWWSSDVLTYSSATLQLEGAETEATFLIGVTTAGVAVAEGRLAEVTGVGEYPLASEAEAFERLSDPRFAVTARFPDSYYQEEYRGELDGMYLPLENPPALPDADALIPWPVQTRELVSVAPGWLSIIQTDGPDLIVPSYTFSTADGITYEVIALADEVLNFTDPQ